MDWGHPKIMGILNVTPDSFSDGGAFLQPEAAIRHLHELMERGADIIDVGGESTGPGSQKVSVEEELRRVKPVIDHVHQHQLFKRILFSIDTYKAAVAEYALGRGFGMVNDVTALRGDPQMLEVLARHQPYLVLMYSKDPTPRSTREPVQYDDVMDTIKRFLLERLRIAKKVLPSDRIILDPGMGAFVSADPRYSFEIIDRLDELALFSHLILVGPSRKSFIGGGPENRDAASWELARRALKNGAAIVRMHTLP